jgi:SAM-dependent methyltransferase
MKKIANLDKYNNSMKKSLIDKIFFVDKVPSDFALLDFGCANGTLLRFMRDMFPENSYVGYDNDPTMVRLALEENGINDPEFYCYDNFTDALGAIHSYFKKTKILNLSSMIHEVYSYSSYNEVEKFWEQVFNGEFTHIVIRDMIPSNSINRETYPNDIRKILKNSNSEILNSFESHWGSIKNLKNLTHYLLKYRYTENWEREVRENYLPLTLEDLYIIIDSQYDIIYQEHYCLPFLHETIKQDFDIDFNEPTHLKLILKRK